MNGGNASRLVMSERLVVVEGTAGPALPTRHGIDYADIPLTMTPAQFAELIGSAATSRMT